MSTEAADLYFVSCTTPFGFARIGASALGIAQLDIFQGMSTEVALSNREMDAATPESIARLLDSACTRLTGCDTLDGLPLHMRGTPFQQDVWLYLQTVPRGETRTYSEIANAIGRSKAVRAVASACARNRIAIAIPCHRVVRADGDLGGYKWGAALKRQLLSQELDSTRGDRV